MGFRSTCDLLDKCRLAIGIGDTVVRVGGGQVKLEPSIYAGGLWIGDEVVAEK
jgi:hypothetical protein